jgi:hypothetical protein
VVASVLLGCAAIADSAYAQTDSMVMLRVEPRSGDTLRVRVSGWEVMTLHVDLGTGDCCMAAAGSNYSSRRLITIEHDSAGTILAGILDSLDWTWRGQHSKVAREISGDLPQSLGTVRMLPDGSARLLDKGDGDDSIEELSISSEAMLPTHLVHPGSTWEAHGFTYALADLSPRSERAFMSFAGTAEGDSVAAPITNGVAPAIPDAIYLVTGTVRGALTLDRKRGYWARIESYVAMRADAVMRSDPKRPMRVGDSEVFLAYETASTSVLVKK